ncbi:MAG: DNA polymerase IV, partial [Arcobacteraceae bacterium]|nr:DNA polymerase IV [Arcobacteraceae bacterium]
NGDKTFEDYFVDDDGRVRGIITTSSYEARAYGVKTAMNVAEALRWCPTLTVLPPNYPLYHELSHKLKLLLEKEIPSIEQFSIDEFFGDITGWIKDEDAFKFCKRLKDKVMEELKIPVSIGVSKTKWIAKLGTNRAKPAGVFEIKAFQIDEFIKDIPISAFPGIGKGYQERLGTRGIQTLGDIKSRRELFERWGKPGMQIYNRVCGIDNEKIALSQGQKSIGLGRTFDPLNDRDEIKRRLTILCRHLSFLSLKGKHNPMTYSLNIRYQYGAKSKDYINSNRLFNEQHFKEAVIELFTKIDIHPTHNIIQVNITLSNFEETKTMTMNLLEYENDTKQA